MPPEKKIEETEDREKYCEIAWNGEEYENVSENECSVRRKLKFNKKS